MIGARRSRRSRALLRDLGVQRPADVRGLSKRLAARRGRPILLRAHPIRVPGVYGTCLSTGSADFIFYESRTSPVHQDHIILHELVHLVAGHGGAPQDDSGLKTPFSGGARDGPARRLRRHRSGDGQEDEAEDVAAMAMGWAPSLNPRAWARHRRIYRDLVPLWVLLHDACPAHPAARKSSMWWPPWQTRRRAYRRLIECRDGLVRLSQYLGQSGSRDDRDLAGRLLAAADVSPGRDCPVMRPAVPVAIPRSPGLDADADALVHLSRAIGSSGFRRGWPIRHPARLS